MAPPIQLVRAADEADVYYVLDTDGIDAGKQYLIVSSSGGNMYALGKSGNSVTKYSVTVADNGTRIASGFTGENFCLSSFNITSTDGKSAAL